MPQDLYRRFIDDIAFQTCLLFDVKDIDEIESFRDYLESSVLEEIIHCKDEIKPTIRTYKHSGNQTCGFLKAALIASGISEDGILPFRYNYAVKPLDNSDGKFSKCALKRYRELADEYYYDNYGSISLSIAQNCVQNDYVDVEETLKGFFYMNDRTSSLIYEHNAFPARFS